MTDLKPYLIAGLIFVVSLLIVWFVRGAYDEQRFARQLAEARPDTVTVIDSAQVKFLEAVIDTLEAEISWAKEHLAATDTIIQFYRRVVTELEASQKPYGPQAPVVPVAKLEARLQTTALVNDNKVPVRTLVTSDFHFGSLTFQDTRVAIMPFSIPVETKYITRNVWKPSQDEWLFRSAGVVGGAATAALFGSGKPVWGFIAGTVTLVVIQIDI